MKPDAVTAEREAVLPVRWESRPAGEAQTSAVWTVEIKPRAEIEGCDAWGCAFSGLRKDRRYYELVEDTIHQGFDYRYLVLSCGSGAVRAIQPCFILDQDLLAGSSEKLVKAAAAIRRIWPRFLRMRTMMIGCAAGEGHLDAEDKQSRAMIARSLAQSLVRQSRRLKTKLIVFKEFTVADRAALACLQESGFTRVPSMPMTRRELNFASFEDYMRNELSANTRSKLRRDFRESAQRAQLEMRVVTDITPHIDEIYPLYLAVYERSSLQFEKLTKDYLCKIGRLMPDKVQFFLMIKEGKIVAFNLCLKIDKELCSEYVGFDYSVAYDLHLYNVMTKNVMEWAIANGFRWYCSTGLNYEPKYRLRHSLDPLDLYVRHTSPLANFIMKRALKYIEPTHNDAMLPRFPNYQELRGA
jgi:predicted N-acyltransferase